MIRWPECPSGGRSIPLLAVNVQSLASNSSWNIREMLPSALAPLPPLDRSIDPSSEPKHQSDVWPRTNANESPVRMAQLRGSHPDEQSCSHDSRSCSTKITTATTTASTTHRAPIRNSKVSSCAELAGERSPSPVVLASHGSQVHVPMRQPDIGSSARRFSLMRCALVRIRRGASNDNHGSSLAMY